MADALSLGSLNPFANISLGSMSTYASIGIVIAIVVMICGLVGLLVYIFSIRKAYWIKIECSRLVGGKPQRIGFFSAKEVPFGMAGDKLWRVSSAGIFKFKVVKWLPVGTLQSAPNTYKYWLREDGEWINYIDDNIDEISKKMRVKFVQEDMRLQRLATDRLLEQRHMKKDFWEKWRDTIVTVIIFLVISVSVVIVFYQFSKLLDKMGPMMTTLNDALKMIKATCFYNATSGGQIGLIPA